VFKTILSAAGVYKAYEKWLWRQVKNGVKPEHIAIILDGNRRWATDKALNTLYTLSTENFQRSKGEVEEIMRIAGENFRNLLTDERIHKNRVRVKVIGRLGMLPLDLQQLITDVENTTQNYDEHFLNFAFAYGGRAEIVDAAKKIAEEVYAGKMKPEKVDEKTFEKYLYTSHLPKQDPDLIIRTSGEERLSGFLIWQSAYSELCFLDVYWPDFRLIDLLRAVRTFQNRKRRFGA
jgi:tritrans,polycis-undecaprenyl-diphosphate synthase [geranylgeranyl-diphosphate specific]